MNIPWLTPIIGSIADGKIAAMLQTQVELIALQRDEAIALSTRLKSEIASLNIELSDCKKKASDLEETLREVNDFHKNDGIKIIYNTIDESGDTLQ